MTGPVIVPPARDESKVSGTGTFNATGEDI